MTAACWVYIIGPAEAGPVKIGRAKNPEARLRELQTGYPDMLFLHWKRGFATTGRAHFIEKYLHFTMTMWRMRGEWFRLDPKQAIYRVEKIIDKQWINEKKFG